MNNLTVTIAIPTLNEAKTIRDVIVGFLNNTYENIIEIIVTDGGSTDETVHIVKELSQIDSRIKIISNPNRIQSSGLNQVLEIATGDLFLRADAHSIYDSTYVEECVAAIVKSNAVSVGGAQRFSYKNPFQKAVSVLAQNPFGNGFASYRNPNYSGFVDTVYLGCFRTKELKALGGYLSCLPINEDFELNSRIRQTFGNKSIFLSSNILVCYFPRDTFNRFAIQYFKYGLYKQFTSRINNQYSLRSVIPVILFVLAFPLLISSWFYEPIWIMIRWFSMSLLMIWASLFYSANKKLDNKNVYERIKLISTCTLSFGLLFTQQISFSIGYLTSVFLSVFNTRKKDNLLVKSGID